MLLEPEPAVTNRWWWMGSTSIWEYVGNGNATSAVMVPAAADPADTATAATTPAAVTALAVAAASTRLKRICLLLQRNG
jgi:hypothetical protein